MYLGMSPTAPELTVKVRWIGKALHELQFHDEAVWIFAANLCLVIGSAHRVDVQDLYRCASLTEELNVCSHHDADQERDVRHEGH